jgi:RHS repeat-associated protein/uncharacterized delta-60 repeat protein
VTPLIIRLGLSTVVERSRPADGGVALTYVKYSGETVTGDGGDQYIGLDRFGRVVDQRWSTSSSSTVDRFQYGYDRDSNVMYKKNLVSSSNSELYHANGSGNGYDSLNRLTAFSRGTLNSGDDSISSSSASASWSLDALGNWSSSTADGTSTSRTTNAQNQVTEVSSDTLGYDLAGDMTTDQNGNTLTYDAWGHLMSVTGSDSTPLASYRYDALGRRDHEVSSAGPNDVLFNSTWQAVEDYGRGLSTQYVWSPVATDALVERSTTQLAGTPDLSVNGDGVYTVDLGDDYGPLYPSVESLVDTGSQLVAASSLAYGTFVLSTLTGGLDVTGSDDLGTNVAMAADGDVLLLTDGNSIIARYGDGSEDTTFGSSGSPSKLIFDTAVSHPSIQLDSGGIIVSGDGGDGSDLIAERLNSDGSMDTTFGTDGVASISVGESVSSTGLAIESDGKIVLVGSTSSGLAVAVLNSDGSADTAFGSDGVIVNDSRLTHGATGGVAVDSSGNIYIAGSEGSSGDYAVVKYTSSGALDTSFGSGGETMVSAGVDGLGQPHNIVLDSGGKIIVGGASDGDSSPEAVVRFNTDGTPDKSFGYNGVAMASPDVPSGNVGTMMVLSSGEIVVLVAGELSDSDSGFSLCYITTTAGSTQNVFAEQDANDNTTSLTDSSGTVLQRFEYDPQGTATALTPSWVVSADVYAWLYGYQGGRLDPSTGFIVFRHRDYSPTLGRWLQTDPAGYVDGASLYDFNQDSPATYSDPQGLQASHSHTELPAGQLWLLGDTRLDSGYVVVVINCRAGKDAVDAVADAYKLVVYSLSFDQALGALDNKDKLPLPQWRQKVLSFITSIYAYEIGTNVIPQQDAWNTHINEFTQTVKNIQANSRDDLVRQIQGAYDHLIAQQTLTVYGLRLQDWNRLQNAPNRGPQPTQNGIERELREKLPLTILDEDQPLPDPLPDA